MARLTSQVASALLYASSSLLIIFVNKIVLTVYNFPSYTSLAMGQLVMTLLLLHVLRFAGLLSFSSFNPSVMVDVFPLPLFSFLNMVTGLGGTKALNLPMLTVLRRFSVPMTMALEWMMLGRSSSFGVQMSVLLMVVGALVAAADDLAFDLTGYTLTLLNDVFTALNAVVVKQKLETKSLGTYGLMYYNTLFSLVIIAPLMMLNYDRDVRSMMEFSGWTDPVFLMLFGLSSVLGFVLNYSTYWCTHVNSALTTTVVGCLKNVLSTYVGMMLGGDYIFTMVNFMGLNLSVLGSLVYSAVRYYEQEAKPASDVSEKHAQGGPANGTGAGPHIVINGMPPSKGEIMPEMGQIGVSPMAMDRYQWMPGAGSGAGGLAGPKT